MIINLSDKEVKTVQSVCVMQRDKILLEKTYGLYNLNKCGNTNKKNYEDLQICKDLVEIAKHYRVNWFFVEKLNIKSKDYKKGGWFNKCVNKWRRNKLVANLQKHCSIIGIGFQEVSPEYSSFMGQINNPEKVDSIAAAIELNQRGLRFVRKYKYNENVEGGIIGATNKLSSDLVDRWKKKLNYDGIFSTYKHLYEVIKKSGHSYRCLFQPSWFFLRLKSSKSIIDFYTF